MSNKFAPLQSRDQELLNRMDRKASVPTYVNGLDRQGLILRLEAIVRMRDHDKMWDHLLETLTREDYIAAIKLLKAGIDIDSPTIFKVTIWLT